MRIDAALARGAVEQRRHARHARLRGRALESHGGFLDTSPRRNRDRKGSAAAAIGRSEFIPYVVEQRRFAANFAESFITINLSQFPETLIESELFGHRKGACTGIDASPISSRNSAPCALQRSNTPSWCSIAPVKAPLR